MIDRDCSLSSVGVSRVAVNVLAHVGACGLLKFRSGRFACTLCVRVEGKFRLTISGGGAQQELGKCWRTSARFRTPNSSTVAKGETGI